MYWRPQSVGWWGEGVEGRARHTGTLPSTFEKPRQGGASSGSGSEWAKVSLAGREASGLVRGITKQVGDCDDDARRCRPDREKPRSATPPQARQTVEPRQGFIGAELPKRGMWARGLAHRRAHAAALWLALAVPLGEDLPRLSRDPENSMRNWERLGEAALLLGRRSLSGRAGTRCPFLRAVVWLSRVFTQEH